jgi:sporulation protein YlmC with PRC-barrel domain
MGCGSDLDERRHPMTITRVPTAPPGQERETGVAVRDDDAAPRLLTTSRVCGSKVINQQDETLGEIGDVVIDMPRGRIAYAAMASGGLLGLGERRFTVPWSALRYDAGRESFVLDARKEIFENAPGFDKDRWPSEPPTDDWHDRVHRYYGAPLDWT